MNNLLAYHSKLEIKKTYLDRVKAHRIADEIVKGQYWSSGKGCAVGCTIHSSEHMAYETELGIPVMLARLEDAIFEGSSNAYAKTWPERFLKAIKPGADLSKVGWKFQHWLLLDPKYGAIRNARPEDRELFNTIGGLIWDLALGKQIDQSAAWSAAWSAAESARSAAESAWSAAWSAAESARSAAWSARSAAELAESAARSAGSAAESARSAAWSARSAAESAESAARSARSAAWSVRSAAESAESAARSARSARSAAYGRQGDYLIKLLKAAR